MFKKKRYKNMKKIKSILILPKKGRVTFSISKNEVNYLSKFIDECEKDKRKKRGLMNTYLIIRLYSQVFETNEFIPIHSDVFKEGVSSRRYKEYRGLLKKWGIIEYKFGEMSTYKDKNGKLCYKSKATQYKVQQLSMMRASQFGENDIYFTGYDKTNKVTIHLSKETCKALILKMKSIEKVKMKVRDKNKIKERIEDISENNDHDMIVTDMLIQLIKDINDDKINARSTWESRLKKISEEFELCPKYSREEYSSFRETNELFILKLINNIKELRYDKRGKISHITEYFPLQINRNQLVTHREKLAKDAQEMEMGYYADLSVGIEGLDYCYRMADLKHIARINSIPTYHEDGKIYSALANLRREVRKHVYYKEEQIVEVSDIRSAHFTMLPMIFERCGIEIPRLEMERYKDLTQTGDIYSEVVKGTTVSRNDIKPLFQSFYSSSSEIQYIYHFKGETYHKMLICLFFNINYPNIYNAIKTYNKESIKTLKSVANEVESEIMNPICDRIRAEGLHPFRIHDAIYMTQSEHACSKIKIKELAINFINFPNLIDMIN